MDKDYKKQIKELSQEITKLKLKIFLMKLEQEIQKE